MYSRDFVFAKPCSSHKSKVTAVTQAVEKETITSKQKDQEIVELATPENKVAEYIKSICRNVFSTELIWGNRHNLNKFMKRIDDYVALGRNETYTADQLSQGIQMNELVFIRDYQKSVSSQNRKRDKLATAALDRESTKLCHLMIQFIFNVFINFFISNAFYVTEIEGKGYRLYYFEKEVWNQVVKRNMSAIHHHFQPVGSFWNIDLFFLFNYFF
jgi:hypothetical protein